MADAAVAEHGYKFIPGPSGSELDFVLRRTDDESKGFQFEGPDHFAKLAKSTMLWAREKLVTLCGLEALPGFASSATPYVTPGLLDKEAPILLLCCGDVPGGDAGTWSRRLLINEGTVTGTMFEYISRAQQRGWSVIVADSHAHAGTASPHAHIIEIWQKLIAKSKASKLLIVGHSYGGPNAVGMLKAEPEAVQRLGALVGTDAMAWGAQDDWSSATLDENVPTEEEVRAARANNLEEALEMRERCASYAKSAPAAFAAPPSEVTQAIATVGRNFVASALPAGTPIRAEQGLLTLVSAGAEEHGATTNACIDAAFAFLDRGAAGTADAANQELRQ